MTFPLRHSVAGALAAAVLAASAPAHAYKFNDYVEVYGYGQVWLTLWEEMEDAKGLFQQPSKDEAADALSGFSLGKARLGIRLAYPELDLSLHAQARLEKDFMLLDADIGWAPVRWFTLHVGQLKVPGSFEALTEDRGLDFILRTDITTGMADWSLSKAQHSVSLLYGSASNLRDLGLSVKGEVGGRWLQGRYFLMVGNGLGAGMYFGGATKKEYWITNKAQFYYAGRLEIAVPGKVALAAFGSYNRHDNIVFNSGRAVYDINRRMVGGDLRVEIPRTGVRLYGLGGGGQIRDDFNGDGKVDLRYLGWAAAAMWNVFPAIDALFNWQPPEGHALELGFRYDMIETQQDDAPAMVHKDHYTLGLSYLAGEHVKVQLNYILRRNQDPAHLEQAALKNDIVFANFQAAF
ncbi:MAG: porin [Myxococcales bacterium]